MRRWTVGVVLAVIGVIALAIATVVVGMQTQRGRELVRSQLEAKLDATFLGGASIGHVEGTPFSTIVLKDLVINGPDGRPAIRVGTTRVRLGLLPLIRNQVAVSRLELDDVDVALDRGADGELRVAHLLRPGPSSSWSVYLQHVAVHRAHVMIEPSAGGERIDLDDLDIVASVRAPHGGTVKAAAKLSGRWRQRDVPVELAASVQAGKEHTRVPSAFVRVSDIVIAAGGVDIPRDASTFTGAVLANIPAMTVAKLRPGVEPPLDVTLAIEAAPAGGNEAGQTRVAIDGALGGAPLHVRAQGEIKTQTASGTLDINGLDLFALSHGFFDGLGDAHVTFDVAHGDGHAEAMVNATGTGGLEAKLGAAVTKQGRAIVLDRAALVAVTHAPARAAGGTAPVRGAIDARLSASGALAPALDLAVAGHVDGRAVHVKDISAGALALRIDATHLPSKPLGSARLVVDDLVRGDLELGKLTIAGGNRPDRKLQVSVRSEPKHAEWLVDADFLVTPGETIGVDVQRHVVRIGGGATWTGHTGRVAIGPQEISIAGLHSESSAGQLAVDGAYERAGRDAGDLQAKLDGKVDLSEIKSTALGSLDASVDVSRVRGEWRGGANISTRGVSLSQIVFDATAKLDVEPGRLRTAIDVTSGRSGAVHVAGDIAAPHDLANAHGWRELSRHALHDLRVSFDHVDLAVVAKLAHAQAMAGQLDGQVAVRNGNVKGALHVRGVHGDAVRDLGEVSADVDLAQPTHDELDAKATGKLQKVGGVTVAARFGLPEHVLDPHAWQRLGVGAFRGASLRTDPLAFEPGTLERLGWVTNLRGKAAASAELGPGLANARVVLDVSDLHGGPIAMPVVLHVDATVDQKQLRAGALVRANGMDITRATLDAPVSLDRLRTEPRTLRAAPLHGTIEIPNVDAKRLLAVLGNTEVVTGTLDGKIAIAGTLAKPTVQAHIVARDIGVPPDESGRPVPMVQTMTIDGAWDGAAGKLAIAGVERSGGRLDITASGRRDAPADFVATLTAHRIDLAPLVAFMPGPAGGVGGQLEANLTLRGLDPKTADLAGNLRISEGRLPIAPQIGTLFHGDLALQVAHRSVAVTAAGKLGNGTVRLVGTAPLSETGASSGQLELTVRRVQLIGTTEPIIDGLFRAKVVRANGIWHADVRVSGAAVRVPETKGEKLDPVGPPPDLVYGGEHHHQPASQVVDTPPHRTTRVSPVLVLDVQLAPTKVEAKELRGDVSGQLHLAVGGSEVSVVGDIGLDHGDLDLFDRRYQVDRAVVHFDGSVDPVFDVRITHDFPDVTTITEIRGRASRPELGLSSSPGIYSQAELLGFLLGGEPNGDPNNAPSASERVAAAGESYLANKVGGYVKKALPVDVDVLRYESATSSSSAAVTVGTWLTHELFLAYRRHLESRPDENAGEGEVEYWLRRRLVLAGTLGDRGHDGIDLLWRRRW